jgi:NADH-quinone oxidoreductase subunit F
MEKLKSIDNFNELQSRLSLIAKWESSKPTIIISAGTCGQASGANDIIRITKREIINRGLTEKINLRITGCHGFCQMEPSILIEPKRTFYPIVNPNNITRIIDAVLKQEVLEDFLYIDPLTNKVIEKQDDIPFFSKQNRQVLSNNEKVDPIRIFNYIENDGYLSLIKVLSNNNPAWVI